MILLFEISKETLEATQLLPLPEPNENFPYPALVRLAFQFQQDKLSLISTLAQNLSASSLEYFNVFLYPQTIIIPSGEQDA